jgi:hypothetical protein
MHAPQILSVDAGQDASELVPFSPHFCQGNAVQMEEQADDVFSPRQRIRVQGNFVVPAGETLNAHVIATGELRFGPGARFFGSAKSYKDTVVEQDACVHGSIVCGGTLHLRPGSFVAGPVMAEGDILMDRGSSVGRPDALTTVSSSGAKIVAGCQLHGTVWARTQGNVEN